MRTSTRATIALAAALGLVVGGTTAAQAAPQVVRFHPRADR